MFMEGRIRFDEIQVVVEKTLSMIPHSEPDELDDILDLDREARRVACSSLHQRFYP